VTSVSIYDSLGQLRQTQTAAESSSPSGPNIAVTDRFYDSHGWVWQSNNKYVVSGSPSTSPVSVAESDVNDRTITSYNGAGQVTGQQDYNGDVLTDSTQTVQGGNQVTSIRYDASGNVIGTPSATVTNVLGQQTETIQYAGDPSVSSSSVVTGGSPQVTSMSYNTAGNETGITDPSGNNWSYGYNLLGQQTTATDPDTGTTTTTYDAAGNIASTTDANGTSVNYTYDALNRKTAEYTGSTTQGAGTEVATWVWDTLAKGLLSYETSITPSGTYETGNRGYDPEGDVSGTWVEVPSGQPLAGVYQTQYAYSTTGLLLTESTAAGGGLPDDQLTWTYDQYGNPLTEIGNDDYVSGATYTPYNEISQVDLGTGSSAAALSYSYDPQTRATTAVNLSDGQAGGPQVDNTAYTYNADQQITSITDTQGASGSAPTETQCFNYDGLSRLSQAWTSTDSCADNPASDGNSTVGGPQPYWQSWTFDQLGDVLTATNHAPAGSASGNTTTSYNYGAAGHAHAISSTQATNSATGGTTTTSYAYNADGETTTLGSQALTWNYSGTLAAAGNTSYIYDADGNELAETTPSGTTLYLPGEEITSGSGGTSGVRYYTFDGQTIGLSTGSNLYWTETNLQGSITTAVNAFSESSPAIYRTFTPYGTALTSTGEGPWPTDQTFLNDTDNTTSGLIDIGARKYNPATGTFISVDPVLDATSPQTMTGYTYGADDPVNNQDPTGQMLDYGGSPGPSYHPPTPHNSTSTYPSSSSYNPYSVYGCVHFDSCSSYYPSSDNFPTGYHYYFDERILPILETGSPASVMKDFQEDPRAVFPFKITGCNSFAPAVTCTLHPAPGVPTGTGQVSVETTRTSFTFTVLSHDYFDAPGSHITFSLYQSQGYLYLSQRGVGYDSSIAGLAGVYSGFAEFTWQRQAANLSALLAENYLSRSYLGQPPVWP
jgi:RHS repeat-associated protein